MKPTADVLACAALFEPAPFAEALLDARLALALARAEAGLQSWASAREADAACRAEAKAARLCGAPPLPADGTPQELLATALLLQTRRALVVIEAEIFASAHLLLDLAAKNEVHRPRFAHGLQSLLGRIEPLRSAAAGVMLLPFDGNEAFADILGRNLGLVVSRGAQSRQAAELCLASELALLHNAATGLTGGSSWSGPSGPSALPKLLAATHTALVALHDALQGLRTGLEPQAFGTSAPALGAADTERVLAEWRHRLPHLQPQNFSHDDPRVPAD